MSIIQNINIIPEPVLMEIYSENFILTEDTRIYSDQELLKLSEYLKNILIPATGFNLNVKEANEKSTNSTSINLKLTSSNGKLGSEGYFIYVTSRNINITAPYPAGIFYGIQTLRQLLPTEIENSVRVKGVEWQIPCLKLEDFPRFSWRCRDFACQRRRRPPSGLPACPGNPAYRRFPESRHRSRPLRCGCSAPGRQKPMPGQGSAEQRPNLQP